MKLVLIHGRGQASQNPEQLRQQWLEALSHGCARGQVQLPADTVVEFPYYGDLLASLVAQVGAPLGEEFRAKGAIPVAAALHWSGPLTGSIAGIAAMLGHGYPLLLGFGGGKGVATGAGAALALFPAGVGLAALAWAITFFTLRYASVASLTAGAVFLISAIALAQRAGGSVPRFVGMMNRRARAMGLVCTRFSRPDGYRDRGNHSCAGDLAQLARAVLRVPRLAHIVRRRSAVLPFPIKGGKLYLYNHNPLLQQRYPGTIGIKTGFTDAAGRCLVAAVQRGGHRLGVVLLHSPDPGGQAKKLFDRGFRALGA